MAEETRNAVTADDGKTRRWKRRGLIALSCVGNGLAFLAAVVAWAAFGWRDALLVLTATIGGMFWAYGLWRAFS